MKDKDYKIAAKELKNASDYISFLRKGLHGNADKMFPVKISDRLDIIIKLWK